jgi:hypothetical protein
MTGSVMNNHCQDFAVCIYTENSGEPVEIEKGKLDISKI